MKLAEAISERVPSCERVRLMNSGTEATSTAVRLARGFTGRDRIVTFHGNFHGATDALLAAGGSGVATLGLPGTAGVPAGAVAETLVVPYNGVPALDERRRRGDRRAGRRQHGRRSPPQPGFLDGLRAECDRVGALLIFDEVITGFRLDRGGAQAKYDVTPGPHDVRQGDRRRPADRRRRRAARGDGDAVAARPGVPRRHAGGQPAGHRGRAGRARPARPRRLHRAGGAGPAPRRAAARGLRRGRLRRPSSRSSARSSAWSAATCPPPVDFDGAKRTDEAAYAAFFQAMLAEGVALAPGAYEAIFVGLGHDDAVLDDIAARRRRAVPPVAAVAADRPRPERRPAVPTAVLGRVAPVASAMRQVLSWRFVAAHRRPAAGSPLLVVRAVRRRRTRSPRSSSERPDEPARRPRVDRARHRARRASPCRPDGVSQGELTMSLVPSDRDGHRGRSPGTPGEVTCPDLDKAVRAARRDARRHDRLVRPRADGPELPASSCRRSSRSTAATPTSSTAGRCRYAAGHRPQPAASRPAESFSEFLRLVGRRHRSLYDLGRGEITAVVC